ncbi:hypothetical protein DES53_109219 [Roseimicrobium gellanilyticum]|uniref:Uncharacterized protein n=1 Tax=Roseimicrobium gellanilyticum TaxID=748857 RepID=A0A366HBQ5_9BACT|nr:hypothetical protein DES53_109219 [Roseimicrobium gellanilyticum]
MLQVSGTIATAGCVHSKDASHHSVWICRVYPVFFLHCTGLLS